MPGKPNMSVREYVDQLRKNRKGKPLQIREALDIYIDLWETVIKNGVVAADDEVSSALVKLDEVGGLYGAAG